jgi:dTDP-4-amino-4,6-dideoxygalactose transaminase
MDAICDIARRHKLAVVEDAAEAHGAKYKGRNAGTIGDLAAFSLYVAHIITSIEGGIVTTNDAELAGVLRSLRCHGRACKCDSCVVNTGSGECRRRFAQGTDIRFIFERIGFSAKMNELEAAVGLGSLELYDLIVSRRHTNLMAMMGVIRGFEPLLQTFRQEKHEFLGPHALPVLVGPEAPFTRDELVVYLAEKGVDTRSLFASMPTQCAGFAFLGRRLGEFPQAEYIGEHGFHVGVHQEVTPEQIDYFRDVLAEFLKERA